MVHRQRARSKRPDPLNPKVQRHSKNCTVLQIEGIADKPELSAEWVTLVEEPTHTFCTCRSCGLNWYVYDEAPKVRAAT